MITEIQASEMHMQDPVTGWRGGERAGGIKDVPQGLAWGNRLLPLVCQVCTCMGSFPCVLMS